MIIKRIKTSSGDVFFAESTYTEKDRLRSAGFWWHNLGTCYRKNCEACLAEIDKVWWTPSKDKALRLVDYFEDGLKSEFSVVLERQEQLVEESRADDAEIDVPCPDGLNYLSFQKAGIKYIVQRLKL